MILAALPQLAIYIATQLRPSVVPVSTGPIAPWIMPSPTLPTTMLSDTGHPLLHTSLNATGSVMSVAPSAVNTLGTPSLPLPPLCMCHLSPSTRLNMLASVLSLNPPLTTAGISHPLLPSPPLVAVNPNPLASLIASPSPMSQSKATPATILPSIAKLNMTLPTCIITSFFPMRHTITNYKPVSTLGPPPLSHLPVGLCVFFPPSLCVVTYGIVSRSQG